MTADYTAFAQVLGEMTDEELEGAATDYIWLAEKQDRKSAARRTAPDVTWLPWSVNDADGWIWSPVHDQNRARNRREYELSFNPYTFVLINKS